MRERVLVWNSYADVVGRTAQAHLETERVADDEGRNDVAGQHDLERTKDRPQLRRHTA